mmetsp:Transcript_66213/g.147809  ORF Transcript_66213/g.147809 Transcript_66213/m.147809 type:complete len:246 (+) Transcript_66213:39-776(+)
MPARRRRRSCSATCWSTLSSMSSVRCSSSATSCSAGSHPPAASTIWSSSSSPRRHLPRSPSASTLFWRACHSASQTRARPLLAGWLTPRGSICSSPPLVWHRSPARRGMPSPTTPIASGGQSRSPMRSLTPRCKTCWSCGTGGAPSLARAGSLCRCLRRAAPPAAPHTRRQGTCASARRENSATRQSTGIEVWPLPRRATGTSGELGVARCLSKRACRMVRGPGHELAQSWALFSLAVSAVAAHR